MFVQVLQAKVADADLVRRQVDKWRSELKPGATGYLGSTSGITSDGHFVAVVRFDSAEAAKANSERPEQGAWWDETKKAFDGEAQFLNCPEAETMGAGGSNDAGFVQIMQGRVRDKATMRSLSDRFEERLRERRPDVIGGIIAWHGDGNDFVQTVYFTSEQEAREREKETSDDDLRQEWMSLVEGDIRFLDLPEPSFD